MSSNLQSNILHKSSVVRILKHLLCFIRVSVFGLTLYFSLRAYVDIFSIIPAKNNVDKITMNYYNEFIVD